MHGPRFLCAPGRTLDGESVIFKDVYNEIAMHYQQLNKLRLQLRRREIKVSDALLLLLRFLRPQLPGDRLTWLNRELLGYSKDDLEAFYEKPKFGAIYSFFQPPKRTRMRMEIPNYRFLMGTWGRVSQEGKFVSVTEPTLVEKSIFCNIGIQQIETQLEEIEEPLTSLFSMSFDENTGAEFYCWSKELLRVYEAVRFKLVDFIEAVIDELELAPNER
jgi:hypothetical protein